MLQQGKPTSKIQEWYDKLAPVVEEARETLKGVKPGKLMLRSGCEQDQDGNYRLVFLWQEYVISSDDFVVHWAGSDKEVPSFFQSLNKATRTTPAPKRA